MGYTFLIYGLNLNRLVNPPESTCNQGYQE